jgi:hypothetical protein
MRNLLIILGLGLVISACEGLKTATLFEPPQNPPPPALFHSAAYIYDEYLTSEAWATKSPKCIQIKAIPEAARTGSLGMHVTWNRQGAGCPWLGFGFGWDAWTGKDLSAIKNTAALEFWVRLPQGERANLPWAIGFEDYTGASAWLGMTTNAIKGPKIDTNWVRVELPLSEFNWSEMDADISNIKQVIFQVEAAGEVYIDNIQLIPYNGGYRKRARVPLLNATDFVIDGSKTDVLWQQAPITFGNNQVRLGVMDHFLCIALEVIDSDPLTNKFAGTTSYNGDAFEIAFSSNPAASNQRTHFFSTDHHIGIALGDSISFWDWVQQAALHNAQAIAQKTNNGYFLEAKIDLRELGISDFQPGQLLGLEMAVDHGNAKGRIRQERWNDPANEGFNTTPFRWGEMLIVQPSNL